MQWAYHQKRWFGKWHLYVGIFAGLILTIVGLTGSILVFQDEIDQALNPELFEVAKTQKKNSDRRDHPHNTIQISGYQIRIYYGY
ncbi:PepSY-associated TM helix domain-containing protein [Chryseobacterium sp. POE27]|uniref:PepSY-associated TM helix domain-containing protein n=1 Tax=Chryseobacterium sp. POE27 TaxID=3138177 RepID=UPI00321B4C86